VPRADPVAAVIHALEEPLDFPPLAAATVSGDHVAIAIDEAIPCLGGVLRGAMEALRRAGVEPQEISIVTADDETNRACQAELGELAELSPAFVVHDPSDKNDLCIVGITKRGEPLLVNRAIFDADVVLPVGLARPTSRVYGSLFPRFSDAASIARYRLPSHVDAADHPNGRFDETEEAGWLIGAPLVVEVVPGGGDSLAQVIAGEPRAVAARCEKLYRERWLLHSPQRVNLVIATITGGPRAQRWENVGRALAMADPLLAEGGAIAICSNLSQPPGESLGRLIGSDDLEKAERKILRDQAEDSWPAWQLARALQRGPVYLLSQLDEQTVEDLGAAPVADVAELVRLAGRQESFAIVEDSQHAVVTVDTEVNE
jgi:hypothetical protein